ncbi:HerA helicase [Halalkaliarchaeum sp. AArc-CO]|nr:HerA helicase [Halalkaliarchaeum sp. AArc-CO]
MSDDAKDEETIHVAEASAGPGASPDVEPGSPIEIPAVELLTGRGFVTGKSGSGKSILEGTPVETLEGPKPIEHVTEGERVLSIDTDTGEPAFRPVRASIRHTDDDLLRIELEDGTEIVGTGDHSFLTREDGDRGEIVPVRGDELEAGDPMPTSPTHVEGRASSPQASRTRADGGIAATPTATACSPSSDDVRWQQVASIEPYPGEYEVYDLDVAGTDTFLANGVFVHNSNTASVFVENLLAENLNVLIVDTDGEYYGLKEEYEILHVGADEECDIVVSPEHAEKLANLALEQNVPIILDVSGYLEEDVANELLLETTKHLFAKEKKLKKPFLLVVEECHEYIPESGGMTETGKMLIKVGKRGRKHGLGIVGISQRPANVKKDFITQCDWLVWHRLTWDNDTKVVGRILGSDYADAIEDLDDGEAFLMRDWADSIDRVQFHRKQTFDAGATPGLEDFERPELKSVSGNLVSELEEISDEKERQESKIADLKQELDRKHARIQQLEQELEEARDLSQMADQFAQALLGRAEAPYRGGQGRNLHREEVSDQSVLPEYESDGADGPEDRNPDTRGETTGRRETEAPGEAESPGEARSANETEGSGAADVPDSRAANGGPVAPIDAADVAEAAMEFAADVRLGTREAVIRELRDRIESLPELSRRMLDHYRREGTSEPVAAHIDAGGDGDRQLAYGRNRPVRTAGLIRHTGQGEYTYAIPELVRDAYADRLGDDEVEEMVEAIEEALDDETPEDEN